MSQEQEPIPLVAEIKVGSLVRYKTGPADMWVVVKRCGWPLRGRLKLRRRSLGGLYQFTEYAYPAELEVDREAAE